MKKRRDEDDYAETQVLEGGYAGPRGNEGGAPQQRQVETTDADSSDDPTVRYRWRGSSQR